MTDRPLLFSGPMVRALIDGRKTQTRRVIPGVKLFSPEYDRQWRPHVVRPGGAIPNEWSWWEGPWHGPSCYHTARIRFAVSDRLWVRETWTARMTGGWTIADARSRMFQNELLYAADGKDSIDGWWPSIHMPREFSRLTLVVTEVRVERLQDISEADAIAEGVEGFATIGGTAWRDYSGGDGFSVRDPGRPARRSYRTLWDSLNAKRDFGWDANPWVVAITFTVHHQNIDAPGAREAA